jgi:hypothetical protein
MFAVADHHESQTAQHVLEQSLLSENQNLLKQIAVPYIRSISGAWRGARNDRARVGELLAFHQSAPGHGSIDTAALASCIH